MEILTWMLFGSQKMETESEQLVLESIENIFSMTPFLGYLSSVNKQIIQKIFRHKWRIYSCLFLDNVQ